MPTHDRTLEQLLAYLADYPGRGPHRDLSDDLIHAHAAGLVTAAEFETVLGHIADDMEARGERTRLMREDAEADDGRDAEGEG